MEKILNFEFFIVSFNGFCIYFLLELLLQEILLIVRNFSHSKESDSFITLVYFLQLRKVLEKTVSLKKMLWLAAL